MTAGASPASERLTHEGAHASLERLYGLLNDHDPANIPLIFTEEVVFDDDAWPETVRGHAEMRRFLTTVWRAFPDLRFELVDGPYLTDDGRGVAARVRFRGTMQGPFDPPGFAPTGGPVSIDYGAFYVFDGDRVSRARITVNMNEVATQLRAAPAAGTSGERLVVAAQRVRARLIRRRVAEQVLVERGNQATRWGPSDARFRRRSSRAGPAARRGRTWSAALRGRATRTP